MSLAWLCFGRLNKSVIKNYFFAKRCKTLPKALLNVHTQQTLGGVRVRTIWFSSPLSCFRAWLGTRLSKLTTRNEFSGDNDDNPTTSCVLLGNSPTHSSSHINPIMWRNFVLRAVDGQTVRCAVVCQLSAILYRSKCLIGEIPIGKTFPQFCIMCCT